MRAELRSRLLMAALALSLAATAWVASREDSREEDAASASGAGQPAARPSGPRVASQPMLPTVPTGWPAALKPAPSHDGPAWPEADAIARQAWGLAASLEPQIAADTAAAQTKAEAAAAARQEQVAARPVAPPLDYQMLGRMDEAGRPRIVLSNAQRTLVLGVGDVLDQQWRIDAIGPAGAQLSWLANGQKQNLAYSSP